MLNYVFIQKPCNCTRRPDIYDGAFEFESTVPVADEAPQASDSPGKGSHASTPEKTEAGSNGCGITSGKISFTSHVDGDNADSDDKADHDETAGNDDNDDTCNNHDHAHDHNHNLCQ